MYIFISHSSKDAAIAQELCNTIEANGSECFLAPRNIRSGYEYASEILNGIDRSNAILLLLSESANASPHVLREIERAVSKSIPIIVYKLEEVALSKSLEYFLMTHQWFNAENGDHNHLLKCIEDLKNNTTTAINVNTATNNNIPVATSVTPTVATQASTSNSKKMFAFLIAIAVAITLGVSLGIVLSNSNSDDNNNNNSANATINNVAENDTTNKKNEDNDVSTENISSKEENTSENTTKETTTDESTTEESTTEESTTEESTTENNISNVADDDIELGDTVVFGTYYDADIEWKVIKISDDGTEAVLIAKNILTFKAYDAANSGSYGHKDGISYISRDSEANTNMELQADVRGNSSWENSDIRAWLNSDNDYVKYEGKGPIALALTDNCNAYNLEPGFLYNFTDEELAAIRETTLETKGNALREGETIKTTDRVFLLSMDELQWCEEAGVSVLAIPTPEAVEKNESTTYVEYFQEVYHTDACNWWLREPVDGSASECYQVAHGAKEEKFYTAVAACDGYGVRPAITVDLTSDCIKVVD